MADKIDAEALRFGQMLQGYRDQAKVTQQEIADATVKAQGEADAILIEAQAEADANALLNQSLSENVIKKDWIEKWDGILPKVSSDGGTLVDIGNIAE